VPACPLRGEASGAIGAEVGVPDASSNMIDWGEGEVASETEACLVSQPAPPRNLCFRQSCEVCVGASTMASKP